MSIYLKKFKVAHALGILILIASANAIWMSTTNAQNLDPQNLKLNHNLGADESVDHFVVTQDGEKVVYALFDEAEESWALYQTAADATQSPIRIDQNQLDGTRVDDLKISNDGSYVAVKTSTGLLILGIDGLTHNWAEQFGIRSARFFDIPEFDFTPDGEKIVFVVEVNEYPPLFPVRTLKVANANGEDVIEIYSEQLGNLPTITLSPDSSSVMYGSQVPAEGAESGPKLFVADLEQGNQTLLDANVAGVHYDAQYTPDGQMIVFQPRAKNDEGRVFGTGLFLISKDGTGLIDLNADLMGEDIEVGNFQVSEDGSRIVFYRGEDQWRFGLYSYSVESDELVELAPYKMNENNLWPNEFDISSDSKTVVFRGNINNDQVDDAYYQVPIEGGETITLHSEDTDNVGFLEFKISPNSDYLVFSSYLWEVYLQGEPDLILNSVKLGGDSEIVQIEKDLNRVDGFNSAPDFLFSSNGRRVIYRSGAGRLNDNGGELFSSPLNGSFPLQLSPFSGRDVQLSITELVETNGQIFYRADQAESGKMELFTSFTAGDNQPPAVASPDETIFFAGLTKEFLIEVDDPNLSDGIEITVTTLPEWATFTDNGDGTAVLAGRPTVTDLGQVSIGLTATDEFDSVVLQTLEISIIEIDSQLFMTFVSKSPD